MFKIFKKWHRKIKEDESYMNYFDAFTNFALLAEKDFSYKVLRRIKEITIKTVITGNDCFHMLLNLVFHGVPVNRALDYIEKYANYGWQVIPYEEIIKEYNLEYQIEENNKWEWHYE